jgi:hypothetical protein
MPATTRLSGAATAIRSETAATATIATTAPMTMTMAVRSMTISL